MVLYHNQPRRGDFNLFKSASVPLPPNMHLVIVAMATKALGRPTPTPTPSAIWSDLLNPPPKLLSLEVELWAPLGSELEVLLGNTPEVPLGTKVDVLSVEEIEALSVEVEVLSVDKPSADLAGTALWCRITSPSR